MKIKKLKGQMLVELMLTIGLATLLIPTLLISVLNSREGKGQQEQRVAGVAMLKETVEAVKSVRNIGWSSISTNGTYHPVIAANKWTLAANSETINGFTRQIVISDISRDATGAIVTSGGTVDPSTKKVDITVSWSIPKNTSISSTLYFTRTDDASTTQTSQADFDPGIKTNTQTTNTGGGDVRLANNNRAKWCSPAFSSGTIDLPDGPPVAVAATSSAVSINIPNDVFVATAPYATSSVKLAYVNVTANTATPAASLGGIFTLDASKYSAGTYPSSLGGLTNSFSTTDVKYYTSSGGNIYALMTTTDPSHEVIAIQVKTNGNNSYQDPVNNIYKYWTFFNTKIYGSSAGNDQAPFGYGAVGLTVIGNTGYIDSGGYLYVFNLSNIDSKSPTVGLDQIGCRILLDGYDCQPGSPGLDAKYSSGQSGTSWSTTASPAHNDCSDGGNIELDADHQLSGVISSGHNYIYVAVGAGTNPELDIVDATTAPTGSNLTNSSCGRGTNSGWKLTGSLDFDTYSNTEEAANSVYAKSDGTRAYMSSNGGIMHNGIPDSDQFYIIDTTNKSSPKFLAAWPSTQLNPPAPTPIHYANTASSGYYNGDTTNIELYPRRALTVQDGQRAILVGKDGIPNDGIEPKEYQVLDLSSLDSTTEPNPPASTYCGGLNFLPGFNDMTSVTEINGDNYVYLVANTNEKQLKIIQGGPDNAIYVPSGTFESAPIDATSSSAFNRFVANVSVPASTSLSAQLAVAPPGNNGCSNATYQYIGPDGTANSFFTAVGASISATIPFGSYLSNYQNPSQCLKYKFSFTSIDQMQTPILNDFSVNYSH